MVISLVAMGGYYMHAKRAKENQRTAEESNKDFDAVVVDNQQ